VPKKNGDGLCLANPRTGASLGTGSEPPSGTATPQLHSFFQSGLARQRRQTRLEKRGEIIFWLVPRVALVPRSTLGYFLIVLSGLRFGSLGSPNYKDVTSAGVAETGSFYRGGSRDGANRERLSSWGASGRKI